MTYCSCMICLIISILKLKIKLMILPFRTTIVFSSRYSENLILDWFTSVVWIEWSLYYSKVYVHLKESAFFGGNYNQIAFAAALRLFMNSQISFPQKKQHAATAKVTSEKREADSPQTFTVRRTQTTYGGSGAEIEEGGNNFFCLVLGGLLFLGTTYNFCLCL